MSKLDIVLNTLVDINNAHQFLVYFSYWMYERKNFPVPPPIQQVGKNMYYKIWNMTGNEISYFCVNQSSILYSAQIFFGFFVRKTN